MLECMDCGNETEKLHFDPRTPPLDTKKCICSGCQIGALEAIYEDAAGDLTVALDDLVANAPDSGILPVEGPDKMIQYLIENTSEKGSWSIEVNEHKTVYETVEQKLKDIDIYGFPNPEHKQRCIDTNTMYCLRWYQHTPVGFFLVAAPSYEELVEVFMTMVKKGEFDD